MTTPGPAQPATPATPPLTSDQLLGELGYLTTVTHALIIECLTVYNAVGRDLPPDQNGPVTPQGSDLASTALSLATAQMFALKNHNNALRDAGRDAELGRAASISSASVAEISLAPPGQAELYDLLTREEAMAKAADERYARLAPSVTTAPVFSGDLLDELRQVIEDGQGHTAAFAAFREALGPLTAPEVIRVTRRDTTDEVDLRMLAASDGAYRLMTELLGGQFTDSTGFTPFRQLAIEAMTGLDDTCYVLAQRGLLPPFTVS
jgi:hypothetical protein